MPSVLIVVIDAKQLHPAAEGVMIKLCPLLRGSSVSLGLLPLR